MRYFFNLISKWISYYNGMDLFDILIFENISYYNDVFLFFIFYLVRWYRTRRFSEPTFRLTGATNYWKNIVLNDFPLFSLIYIFLSDFFSSLIFSLLFSSSLWPFPSLFFICPYNGNLIVKFPSIKNSILHWSDFLFLIPNYIVIIQT